MRTMLKTFFYILIFFHSLLYALDSPLTGEWEGQILSARRPIVLYLNFDRMIARMDIAGSQEIPLENVIAEGAEIKFVIPLRDQKLEFTATMIGGQISGTETKGNVRIALNRLNSGTAAESRIESWEQDIETLIERFMKYDRSYSDAERQEAMKLLRNLESTLHERTDEEIIVELSRAIARTKNAHTRLYLLRNRTELRRLPIRVWWMNDGLYVVKTTRPHQDLLSCRVTKIGAHDPLQVRKLVSELFAGNEAWTDYKSTYYMTSPEILRGLKLVTDMENIEFTFQCGIKSQIKMLPPLPLKRINSPTEAWWDLSPEWPEDEMWVHSLSNKKIPLYLKNPSEHYWFEFIESQKALYFQYNRSQNKQGSESLQQFGERLLATLRDSSIKKLIVDLRLNTGGDLGIARDLMDNLKKHSADKQIPVYVLIGRSTFSAGLSHAVQWKESGKAVFVGEPVGDDLDYFSEGGNIVLPNSKLTAHYANGFHTYSKKEYPQFKPYYLDMDADDLEPNVRVSLSSKEYFAGKDPVLDAVFNKPSAHSH